MNTPQNASRRFFLRQSAAMSALVGSAAPLALNLAAAGSAAAQSATDYRAIVCLFFYGGNDSFNMVLPTDAASWNAYTATRTQAPDPIALLGPGIAPNPAAVVGSPARLGGVLPITPARPQGRAYALHPLLGAVQQLFNVDKRIAIIPNIGPLVMPTTKVQYNSGTYSVPLRLFSHNDQQNTWQALGPEGATRGWGGRIGDMIVAANSQPLFTAISVAGNSVFVDGNVVRQYGVSNTGAVPLGVDTTGKVYGSADVGAALQKIVTTSRTAHPFDTDFASVASRSIGAEQALKTALKAASDPLFGTPATSYSQGTDPKLMYLNPLTGLSAANGLAQQFQVVARLIDAGMRGTSGAKRQVFFVSLGGFDTHDFQNRNQAVLMAQLAQGLSYFDTTLGGLNARDLVTTFTASDFGRTFTSNGDGTDHGWGSHHFVMGGAVKGGDLYGAFPTLAMKNTANNNFDGSPDQIGNGSLLPTSSVDQLGATLATWFGVSATDTLSIFPNLANFDVSKRNLGFYG